MRPGIFIKKNSTNYKAFLEPNKWKNGMVSRNQVTHYLIKQAESNEHTMKTPVLIK